MTTSRTRTVTRTHNHTLSFGALPPIAKPRVKLSTHLTGQPPVTPKTVDFMSKVGEWDMLGNDRYGDCAWAGMAHLLMANSAYGDGVQLRFTEQNVLEAYSAATGFNPNSPASDQGTVLQEALEFMTKVGMRDATGRVHKIRAFAQVDVSNPDEVTVAHDLFGGTYNGFTVYEFAMDEFQANRPWSERPARSRGRMEGGHCVPTMKASTSGSRTCVTWGRPQPISSTFWRHYFTESWVVLTDEWIAANGMAPSGLDVQGLLDEVARLQAA